MQNPATITLRTTAAVLIDCRSIEEVTSDQSDRGFTNKIHDQAIQSAAEVNLYVHTVLRPNPCSFQKQIEIMWHTLLGRHQTKNINS